jgi:hypothetical protein
MNEECDDSIIYLFFSKINCVLFNGTGSSRCDCECRPKRAIVRRNICTIYIARFASLGA